MSVDFWEFKPPPPADPIGQQPVTVKWHFGPGILAVPDGQSAPDGVASPAEAINARVAETFRAFGVDEAVLAQRGQPVSEMEYRLAQHRRESLMQDKEWQRKYFDGDQEARRTMATLSIILGSPIKKEG